MSAIGVTPKLDTAVPGSIALLGVIDVTDQNGFTFHSPTRLFVGRGSVSNIPGILSERTGKKALVVTDKGLVKAGVAQQATGVLEAAGIPFAVYDGVEENPPAHVVQACFDLYESAGCDWLLAIGGGSSMDTAKCAGVLAENGGRIEDHFGLLQDRKRVPFLLCVPTTYGTASEVTPFAVVTDDNHFKAAVGGPHVIPDVGILDANVAVGLPMPIAAATGMDALTHAVESYVARASNPIADGLALHAIRLTAWNLRQAASSNHNYEATEQMLLASNMAGIAFSQTRLGNVHAMSHAVGGHYGVPHGVANAILLTRVMDFNKVACPERFADIAVALGENIEGLSHVEAADVAVEAVQSLASDVGIPDTLTEVGVPPEGISVLAEDAMKSGNIQINPRHTTLKDIIALYEAAM